MPWQHIVVECDSQRTDSQPVVRSDNIWSEKPKERVQEEDDTPFKMEREALAFYEGTRVRLIEAREFGVPCLRIEPCISACTPKTVD